MILIMNKLIDWKNRLKKGHMLSVICVLLIIVAILGFILYKKQREYRQTSENSYNAAFFELVDYVQNVETYLAKSLISSTPEHGAETLTQLWREANLAQAYLSRLPIESQELSNTEKFLNQVSDYSYSLSRKNIYNEKLSDEDFKNLEELHNYSVELENTLNQLSEDLNSGRFAWGELTKKGTIAFAQQVDNISKESFSNMEQNFHEYSGLIYDGAFSEHLTNTEPKGLTGEEIDENKAKQKVEEFVGKENIKETSNLGYFENATIPAYGFTITKNNEETLNISISKKGGHIVYMNSNREVNAEVITQEEANEKGKEYLDSKGFPNMKAMLQPRKREGIKTIYLTTNTSSMRVAQYRENNHACIYFCDTRFFRGVMLRGTMEVLTDPASKEMIWQEGDTMYYPEGVTDPDYCVLKFTAISGRFYSNFKSESFAVE